MLQLSGHSDDFVDADGAYSTAIHHYQGVSSGLLRKIEIVPNDGVTQVLSDRTELVRGNISNDREQQ